MTASPKLPACPANASRIEGKHAWERIGGKSKRCIGCGKTRPELLIEAKFARESKR